MKNVRMLNIILKSTKSFYYIQYLILLLCLLLILILVYIIFLYFVNPHLPLPYPDPRQPLKNDSLMLKVYVIKKGESIKFFI